MFYNDFKNRALADHQKASKVYKRIYNSFVKHCKWLYMIRVKACNTVELVLILINSIAHKPKEFELEIEKVRLEKKMFHDTEEYQKKADNSLKLSAFGTAAGVSIGTAVAVISKSAYAGPIGLGIGAGTAAVSILKFSIDNRAIGNKAIKETKKIKEYTQEVKIVREKIITIKRKVFILNLRLRVYYLFMNRLKNANYLELSKKDKIRLGTLVNNTLTLTYLINKKVDEE